MFVGLINPEKIFMKKIKTRKSVVICCGSAFFIFFVLSIVFTSMVVDFDINHNTKNVTAKKSIKFFGQIQGKGNILKINEKECRAEKGKFSCEYPLVLGENRFIAVYGSDKEEFNIKRVTQKKLAAEKAKAMAQKAERERAEKIKKQFSQWDGSHYNLVELVKKNMHNPDSFEHVSTKYWEYDDHLIVSMAYRGSNMFGAIIVNRIKVKTTINGFILKVIK
jgi:hypothetical protein